DPTSNGMGDKEYDEDDVEVYHGERNVLDAEDSDEDNSTPSSNNGPALWDPVEGKDAVNTDSAPKPVGLYPHARRVGDLLYLSGVGPRQPGTNAIPGGPIRDGNGQPLEYDIKAQTRAVVENIARILEEAGSSMDKVVDVTSFLVDMDRDFGGYNEVWAETLGHYGPTRTTLAIRALPTPIAVEMKVIAKI
ncbi:MAG: RidA family protein, partial [Candidatus Poseidoniaceae archaeon]|nr:RidA family protein [Candidatus Poseidoniaceae archaeon]